jgi:hypothetical protein
MSDTQDPKVFSKIQAAHDQLDSFFQSTRDALDGDEAKMACTQLRDALETHFAQEESLYFPTLWNLRPELEQTLRGLIAGHPGFIEKIDMTVRLIEGSAQTDARICFEDLQHQFTLHERSEEETLLSIT